MTDIERFAAGLRQALDEQREARKEMIVLHTGNDPAPMVRWAAEVRGLGEAIAILDAKIEAFLREDDQEGEDD